MVETAHIVVCGMVQGVGYRYFAYNLASDLHLHGYVRNLSTGEVELEVSGEKITIKKFVEKLRIGPNFASVDDVQIEWLPSSKKYQLFEIR